MKNIFCLILFLSLPSFAQQDSSLFDFWIGEWDLTWTDPDGSPARGTNSITKILDGAVIQEDFAALSGQSKGFKGRSFTVLRGRTREWKQTWVDNQNSYLSFTGGANGNERFFVQEFVLNGVLMRQKMIFRNIAKNSFTWDWMKSADSGKTWKTNWTIHYKRKK